MSSVTKRGEKWYAMWRAADGRLAQKVTPARTKAEAVRFAQDKERQAWRQREGLDPAPDERIAFGELIEWWWDRYGSKRRGYANDKFHAFLEKHFAELRSFELRAATAGAFADRLDQILTAKERARTLSAQSLNHLRAQDLNVGAIVNLSPDLTPVANAPRTRSTQTLRPRRRGGGRQPEDLRHVRASAGPEAPPLGDGESGPLGEAAKGSQSQQRLATRAEA
ncbi:MAG TPA: hypothetical protein VFP15_05250 [Gemmatimonadaceae bacterium]|nr:hypothetical protein [Gemmatimonadaceae bacterium]